MTTHPRTRGFTLVEFYFIAAASICFIVAAAASKIIEKETATSDAGVHRRTPRRNEARRGD